VSNKRVIVYGTASEQALVRTIEELRRENAALREDWQLSERRWVAREKEWAEKTVEIEKENAALRDTAVEVCLLARVWVTVWGDKLSPDSIKRFAELEKQILKKAQPWGNDPIMRRHLSEGGTPA
jgi:hypothetical protein